MRPAGARHAVLDARARHRHSDTTVDLGLRSANEIAKGVPLKAIGSWRPDDKGVAEALAMMKALIGEPTPASIGVQALPRCSPVLLESFKTVFHNHSPGGTGGRLQLAKPKCN
ncbi:hypothetical protein LB557_07930 [Mesorhizobium sp. BR115XR7A]|uniref:hypothetical protein n=1 Tax=Mesorhizobium sp. BR115XR7A TaxID=2876645 RepID=UPI001CCFC6A4|nr:hypothetical protein [Mesorhizobium sp. BR115XR7A]MBZ9905924.1 hypothetical protein [Mesorhizobium sp. BR115XR7A]MBZ9930255.1 hypothetical protein [Mesorhizobium sp. BR1-1-5]